LQSDENLVNKSQKKPISSQYLKKVEREKEKEKAFSSSFCDRTDAMGKKMIIPCLL
jgi:hypothetical protein